MRSSVSAKDARTPLHRMPVLPKTWGFHIANGGTCCDARYVPTFFVEHAGGDTRS